MTVPSRARRAAVAPRRAPRPHRDRCRGLGAIGRAVPTGPPFTLCPQRDPVTVPRAHATTATATAATAAPPVMSRQSISSYVSPEHNISAYVEMLRNLHMYVTRSGHGLIHNFGNRSSHVVKATVMTMRLFTAQLLSDEPPPICIESSHLTFLPLWQPHYRILECTPRTDRPPS